MFQLLPYQTKDNANLTKQLNEEFKRPVYWNEYELKIETKEMPKTILQDFILMLLSKELKDCLFLLLTILIMVRTELKETVLENTSYLE